MKSNFIIIFSVFSLAIVFCLPNSTWGQCDFKFDYSIGTEESRDNIYVSLKNGRGNFTFRLHDLITGKTVKEVHLSNPGLNQPTMLFEALRPSRYLIYVFKDNCENYSTLGGIPGIVISETER